jgi:CRISPR/Cas system type I-B associated protein Csh2 (Cas7 group RAMP superfamily)
MKELSEQEVSNTIYYLGKIGMKWEECNEISNSLLYGIENYSSSFKPQGVSNIIYGCVYYSISCDTVYEIFY